MNSPRKERLVAIEAAMQRLARAAICWGSARPGRVELDGGQAFDSASGSWWVVEEEAFDALGALLAASDDLGASLSAADAARWQVIRQAFRALESGVALVGRGPVAPVFDDGDRAVEDCRGRWVVIDAPAYEAFRLMVAQS